jgi:beta-glucosidase
MKREEDTSSYKSYPGVNGEITYSEGVFVGYRHFDQDKIAPLFPFGYGQTYSKFELSGVQVLAHHAHANSADVEVIATLKNVGNYYAAEVVQAYVGELNPSVARPPRELKAFKKVLHLGSRAFAFFDSASSDWKVNPGQFMVNVGFSSRDISSHELVVLK